MYNTGFNTLGIGDPVPAGLNTLGSGDLFQYGTTNKRKKNKQKTFKISTKKFDLHPPLLIYTKEYRKKR